MTKPTRKEADDAAIYLAVHCEVIIDHRLNPKGCMAVDTLIRAYQAVRDELDAMKKKSNTKKGG